MKKGFSQQVVSHNVKEMIRSGHKPKQAVAAALASSRKYKNMAAGGMFEGDFEEDEAKDKMPEENEDMADNTMSPGIGPQKLAMGGMAGEHPNHAKMQKKFMAEKGQPGVEMMANGGLVDNDEDVDSDFDEQAQRGLNEMRIQGGFREEPVMDPDQQHKERELAKALYNKAESEEVEGYADGGEVDPKSDPYNNFIKYAKNQPYPPIKKKQEDEKQMAMGGLVEGSEDGKLGNKPSEDMADGVEDKHKMPHEGGQMMHKLDQATMEAIMERKKKRRYALVR